MVKCDNCKHCTDQSEDYDCRWYWCEIDNMWMNEYWALDNDLDCDLYEQKLDDNETEESSA